MRKDRHFMGFKLDIYILGSIIGLQYIKDFVDNFS